MAATLSGLVSEIVGQAFFRRGFTVPALVTNWPAVVGEDLAASTLPLKIVYPHGAKTGGTLHVRVDGAFALELQHIEPRVIERLNGFYGYAALSRLALHQGPVETRPAEQGTKSAARGGPEPKRFGPVSEPAAIHGIEDQGLKAALRALGGTIQADSRSPAKPEQDGS